MYLGKKADAPVQPDVSVVTLKNGAEEQAMLVTAILSSIAVITPIF